MNQLDALLSIKLFQQYAFTYFEQFCCSSAGGSTLYKQQLVESCVMITIPVVVYTELILLMMSSKPARNM
jgi:hypothetical protein